MELVDHEGWSALALALGLVLAVSLCQLWAARETIATLHKALLTTRETAAARGDLLLKLQGRYQAAQRLPHATVHAIAGESGDRAAIQPAPPQEERRLFTQDKEGSPVRAWEQQWWERIGDDAGADASSSEDDRASSDGRRRGKHAQTRVDSAGAEAGPAADDAALALGAPGAAAAGQAKPRAAAPAGSHAATPPPDPPPGELPRLAALAELAELAVETVAGLMACDDAELGEMVEEVRRDYGQPPFPELLQRLRGEAHGLRAAAAAAAGTLPAGAALATREWGGLDAAVDDLAAAAVATALRARAAEESFELRAMMDQEVDLAELGAHPDRVERAAQTAVEEAASSIGWAVTDASSLSPILATDDTPSAHGPRVHFEAGAGSAGEDSLVTVYPWSAGEALSGASASGGDACHAMERAVSLQAHARDLGFDPPGHGTEPSVGEDARRAMAHSARIRDRHRLQLQSRSRLQRSPSHEAAPVPVVPPRAPAVGAVGAGGAEPTFHNVLWLQTSPPSAMDAWPPPPPAKPPTVKARPKSPRSQLLSPQTPQHWPGGWGEAWGEGGRPEPGSSSESDAESDARWALVSGQIADLRRRPARGEGHRPSGPPCQRVAPARAAPQRRVEAVDFDSDSDSDSDLERWGDEISRASSPPEKNMHRVID
jgi:hypothetical protein